MVDPEHVHRRPADGRAANQRAALVAEVIAPLVPSRVEQRRDLAAVRVAAGQVRPLLTVAKGTGQGEVARDRAAVMVPCDDMIDFECGLRPGLRQAAVFAPSARPLPDQPLQRGVHAGRAS